MSRRAIEAAFLTVLAFSTIIEAYPVFSGGKKYGQRPWAPYPIIYQPRTTKPYAPYYDSYLPDAMNLVDLYYSADPYEKYRLYQMPQYYYPEQYYYNNEEEEDPEEEDIAPYGTLPDTWYDSPNADVNALFLRNLVMAQMYKDAAKNQRYSPSYAYPNNEDYDEDGEPYVFGAPVREMLSTPPSKEDQDVRDLKSLVDTGKQRRESTRRKIIDAPMRSLEENRWVNKRSNFDLTTEPNVSQQSTAQGEDEKLARTTTFSQRTYQPSAYDAIKKLLIQQNSMEGGRQPQKRSYVLNDESLVEQLGKLKKMK